MLTNIFEKNVLCVGSQSCSRYRRELGEDRNWGGCGRDLLPSAQFDNQQVTSFESLVPSFQKSFTQTKIKINVQVLNC